VDDFDVVRRALRWQSGSANAALDRIELRMAHDEALRWAIREHVEECESDVFGLVRALHAKEVEAASPTIREAMGDDDAQRASP
jgi:hypothetical protein